MIVATVLAASLAAALTASSTPADGTYSYNLTVSGSNVGQATITVSHDGANLRIAESSGGTLNGMQVSGTATTILDGDLAPSGYTASYNAGGQGGQSKVTFNGNSASVNGPTGTSTFTLSGGAKHFTVMDGTMMSGFFILPAQVRAWSAQPATVLAPMYGQSVPLPLVATRPNRPASVPSSDISLSVGGMVPFTEWYDPATLLVDEVDVPSQGVVATRAR